MRSRWVRGGVLLEARKEALEAPFPAERRANPNLLSRAARRPFGKEARKLSACQSREATGRPALREEPTPRAVFPKERAQAGYPLPRGSEVGAACFDRFPKGAVQAGYRPLGARKAMLKIVGYPEGAAQAGIRSLGARKLESLVRRFVSRNSRRRPLPYSRRCARPSW